MEGEEPDLSLEDIEKLFAELQQTMTEAAAKMRVLGKRLREQTAIEAAEAAYVALSVDDRPSWFQYIATHGEEPQEPVKFAPKKRGKKAPTQDGHT